MKKAKKIIKPICLALLFCSGILFGVTGSVAAELPTDFYVTQGQPFSIQKQIPVTAVYESEGLARNASLIENSKGDSYQVQLKLFGIFPIKDANVQVVEEKTVDVLGRAFGIKIYTQGVLVVGMTDVDSQNGPVNPAKEAGIRQGDVILSLDGSAVSTNEEVAAVIEQSQGKRMDVVIQRNHINFTLQFQPVLSVAENVYKAGIWVRDSSAGIGTLTFYDAQTGMVSGLGHGICDVDTGEILPLSAGELVGAQILSIVKGQSGSPGELRGCFTDDAVANILCNAETGVYGEAAQPLVGAVKVPLAMKQEIQEGKAQILTTLEDNKPCYYDCVIERVDYTGRAKTQNLVVHITDQSLLDKTGGIVQGMSGSPILQNGRLVGAVTHVFIDDATRGYGIFAENMYQTASHTAATMKKAS